VGKEVTRLITNNLLGWVTRGIVAAELLGRNAAGAIVVCTG
jgi:hypothetical protein